MRHIKRLPSHATVLALVAAAVVWVGCEKKSSSGRSGGGPPELKAEPNPVPPGTGAGKTTLNWRTGADATGQVYVSVDGRPEKKVAEGHRGKKEVDWIHPGKTYQFKLYQGENREKVLASVTVKGGSSTPAAQPASARQPAGGAPVSTPPGGTPAGGVPRPAPGGTTSSR